MDKINYKIMDKTTLKQLKPGTLFRLKDSESSPVWVRDHYDRSSKTIRRLQS